MKHHVKQHYVAKSYLAAWCDAATPKGHQPYVWAFPSEGGEPRKRPPEKLFFERDMYTRTIVIPGVLEARDLRIEAGLSNLEDSFVRLRRDFLDQRKPLPAVPALKLLAFVASQQWRTPGAREHIRAQWTPVLDLVNKMEASARRATPEQLAAMVHTSLGRGSGPSMGKEDVERLIDSPLQETLPSNIEVLTPHLAKLNLAILWAAEEPGFITSDEPCVWFDPAAHKRPPMFQGPALMWPTLEITMPLTPRCMLFLSRDGPTDYLDVPRSIVDELNRRTRAYANEHFVSSSSNANPLWYDRGTPPQPDELGPSVADMLG